jgi:hypothetical protein
VHDVEGDGNCFFHAVSIALSYKNYNYTYTELRNIVVKYVMRKNKHDSFFVDTQNGFEEINRTDWEKLMLKDGYYADALTVLSMARLLNEKYGINLVIYHSVDNNFTKFHNDDVSDPHFRQYRPNVSQYDDLILYYTGNHYMAIVKKSSDKAFGIIREPTRHNRRSKKRKNYIRH